MVLWAAGLWAGQLNWTQVIASAAAGVILWGLYFALGFWAFSKGLHANLLGISLTLAVPLATGFAVREGWTLAAGLLPPGSVYVPLASAWGWTWAIGAIVAAGAALFLARWSVFRCDDHLRQWYAVNQGAKC